MNILKRKGMGHNMVSASDPLDLATEPKCITAIFNINLDV